MDEIITFGNKKYCGRSFYKDSYFYLVAENVLNDALFDNKGKYINEEARMIDENIFFFVDKHELQLSDNDLYNLILEYI